jgi:carboxyl-terminal processing protease
MQRIQYSGPFVRFRWICLCVLVTLPSSLSAQIASPDQTYSTPDANSASTIVPDVRVPDAAALLDDGLRLETEQRWLEAVTHYEDALRNYPDDANLKLHLTLAEIHVDLDRRLADASYQKLTLDLTNAQAMGMFNEIGWKLQSHYVEDPNWQRLTWRGTANLDVALTKPLFVQRNLPGVSAERITDFRNRLRTDVNKRIVRDRTEAQNLVNYSSRLAEQQLGLSPTAVVLEYCSGAVSALDEYSSYLTGAQLDDVYSQIEGNFVGLGVELKADSDELLIVNVIPGGPADVAGIKAGDRIVAVDNQATQVVTTDRAADMLKGEQGTTVLVSIKSDGKPVKHLTVRRDRVEVPSVEDIKLVDQQYGTGYFRLTSFQKTTSRDVDAALWELHRQGMKSLIMDLRGNPGGLLLASVEVADKFLESGSIVSTNGRSPRENFDYKAHPTGTWSIPLIVLIDRDTASASEIFAGAIRDHNRGTVLGERSYGKGSVQGIFPLNSGNAGVRLTTAKFYSPSGRPISKQGVLPTHAVQSVARPISGVVTVDTDPVLRAAVGTARQLNLAHRQ